MEYITWVNTLRSWGMTNLNAASKKTLVFFIAWSLIKKLLIAAAIVFGAIIYILFAVLFGAIKGK